MKITYLIFSISRRGGGLFTSARDLSKAIIQLPGTELEVLSLNDDDGKSDLHTWEPLRPQCFPVVGPKALGFSPALKKKLHELKPDLTHIHGIWMHISKVNLGYSRSNGRPYLISPQGMLDSWAVRNSGWKKKVAGWFYENDHLKEASCLHALSESEAESIRKFGLKNPICVIPNGINLPEDGTASGDPPWKGHIPEDRKILLFLGRIHPKKGLVELLKAWAAAKGKDWHLVIIGWDQGNHLAELKELVRERGCEDRVYFGGSRFGEEKKAVLKAADGFILPSFSEGLPMSVLEAWAYGLPVLMTAECNIPAGFAEGAAMKINAEEKLLARQLEEFFAMPDAERAAMGKRGRLLTETRFNIDHVAKQMHSVYQWALGEGSRPECVLVD